MSEAPAAILTLDGLGVRLPPGADRPQALAGVTLSVAANEILCVVGESGSGKSMMANAIMRLLPQGVTIDAGRVLLEGRDLVSASAAGMRAVRGAGIAMIFQEPMTALNPLRTIGDQIGEMFSIHTGLSRAAIRTKVSDCSSGFMARLQMPREARLRQARSTIHGSRPQIWGCREIPRRAAALGRW